MPGSKSFLFDGGNVGVQRLNLASIFKRNDQNIKANDTVKAVESMSKGEKSYRLQNDIRNLLPGQTIQGAVISRNGSTVQIALSQDLLINARIEQSISLALGQNMSFEVKTNNGAVLSLAPLYANMANQATILRALGAAGLPETAENIEMVARMMEEGMPIDRDTILNVSRQLLEFPTQDPATVIQMIRLGLSITEANIEQFEQYQNAGHQLLGSAEMIAQELPEIFHELMGEGRVSQAYAFYESVLDIFTEAGMAEAVIQKGAENEAGQADATKLLHAQMQDAGLDDLQLTEMKEGAEAQEMRPSGQDPALTDSQWRSLGDMLRELGVEEYTAGQIRNGEVSAKEVLSLIRNLMPGAGEMPSHVLERLFGGKEFEGLLRAEVERQWLIEPREVADPRKVEQLYERIREQSMRLNEAVQTAGKADAPVARSAQNLQNNVDFMNQMNHMFAYIQLPLKMAGNHAHGDLYVYTNKKNLAAKDGNVSALLHLDMEHLGTVDVYVAMEKGKINTNFYLADEKSLDLLEKHIDSLTERLTEKGYRADAKLMLKEDTGNVMEEIIQSDKNISLISDMCFDVRA